MLRRSMCPVAFLFILASNLQHAAALDVEVDGGGAQVVRRNGHSYRIGEAPVQSDEAPTGEVRDAFTSAEVEDTEEPAETRDIKAADRIESGTTSNELAPADTSEYRKNENTIMHSFELGSNAFAAALCLFCFAIVMVMTIFTASSSNAHVASFGNVMFYNTLVIFVAVWIFTTCADLLRFAGHELFGDQAPATHDRNARIKVG